jgi:uncharacterized protein (TIGR03435 family)
MNLHLQPLRSLLPLLALAIPAFGQIGLYGPITTHLKAGDPAPDITFTSLLSAPVSGSWSQTNLTGQLTVVVFYLLTSRNPQPVAMWNDVVEKFSGKPVQFIFITGEKESTLKPWLNDHPIKGWVFHDPDGKTGKAYGLEQPVVVYIGPDRKILGFANFPMADERTINAALEHRITTTHPTEATIQAFIASNQVALDAEPRRMPRPNDNKPNFPPSYTLHISPSQGESHSNSSSDTFRSLQGFTLKEAIQDAYGDINPIRMQLPANLDNRNRYDLALVLPEREDFDKMKLRFQQGILDYFHLTARRENRLVDVYVVTADPNHKPQPLQPDRLPPGPNSPTGFLSSSHVMFESTADSLDPADLMKPLPLTALRGFSIEGTADDLSHGLERTLDRPIVNETNLSGRFEFHIESSEGEKNDFLQRLHDQLGLTIIPGQRNVEMLIFDPR